jgi:hypothetical protein
MLLEKKIFYLILLLRNKQNINYIIKHPILYTVLTNSLLLIYVLVNILYLLLKLHIIFKYLYYIKIKVPNILIFNSLILYIFNLLKNINLQTKFKFHSIKKRVNYFTVPRSPFKHAHSKEYYSIDYYSGILVLNITNINSYSINYQEKYIHSTFNKLNTCTVKFYLCKYVK